MGLTISCLFALAIAFYLPAPHDVEKVLTDSTPDAVLVFAAWQTHMPTKSGNVPHLQPQEPPSPTNQPKIKIDPDQLQREGRELLELSQSLQGDIESVNHGLHPKDTIEKLKRIQKLAKHLRGEIAP